MAIELDRASPISKYRALADNALYYFNALQYMAGGFYRAALGFEVIYDRRREDELNLCLDYFLTNLIDQKLYYFETLKVLRTTRLYGQRWHREIAPKTHTFDLSWPYELERGEALVCRVNCIDKPNHVDIERVETGEVFSVPVVSYYHFKARHCQTKGTDIRERQSSRSRGSKTTKTAGRTRLSLVKTGGQFKPVEGGYPSVPGVRQRLRR
jgi:hypothetical protein